MDIKKKILRQACSCTLLNNSLVVKQIRESALIYFFNLNKQHLLTDPRV